MAVLFFAVRLFTCTLTDATEYFIPRMDGLYAYDDVIKSMIYFLHVCTTTLPARLTRVRTLIS